MMQSEPSFKERVVRVGEHPWGFGLYLSGHKPEFREAFGDGRRFGVMADEVERVCPEAVTRNAAGFRTVDYPKPGVTLSRH